jgi:crossover junction endodeoxyribonuclease RusA
MAVVDRWRNRNCVCGFGCGDVREGWRGVFYVPFPPSVNQYWRAVPMGRACRVLISRRGRKYRADVGAVLARTYNGFTPLDQRLRVQLVLYPPDKRKRDLDNYLKALLDALTHANVWVDDAQIDELTIRRGHVVAGGYVAVTIGIIDAPTKTNIAAPDDIGGSGATNGNQPQFGRED